MSHFQLAIAARERLVGAGIPPDQAAIDAEVLSRHALGWDRASWLARREEPASPEEEARLHSLVARRERREPVAYITGRREFWGLDFEVTSAVLIPRPETEFIVEAALEKLDGSVQPWQVADVCTGSGCLAIVLAHERPHVVVTATDISAAALQVARRNAERHQVADRITFLESSLLDEVSGPFDLIVANPPYVPQAMREHLQSDVKDYEPGVAIFGDGADGLDQARALIRQAPSRLVQGGWLMMEFGFGQAESIAAAVGAVPELTLVEILRDLQRHERTLVARRR